MMRFQSVFLLSSSLFSFYLPKPGREVGFLNVNFILQSMMICETPGKMSSIWLKVSFCRWSSSALSRGQMTALSWCWMPVILRGDFFQLVFFFLNLSYRQQSSSVKNTVQALIFGSSKSNLFKIGNRQYAISHFCHRMSQFLHLWSWPSQALTWVPPVQLLYPNVN